MPVLSVIVPVFNVEKYLDECLDSISKQSFKDIEIICINDGSTDNSYNILKRWALKDNRIIVINQENKGVSFARNIGLQHAKGEFISFVDADDMVTKEIYSYSLPIIINNKLDIYIFSYFTYPNKQLITTGFKTDTIINHKDLLSSNTKIQSNNSLCFNWRFIYKKSILLNNNLLFYNEIAIGEDMIYNIEAICHSKRIMVTDKALYYYRTNNPNSAMSVKYKPKLNDSLNIMYEIKKQQIIKYCIDDYTPYTYDLACYTILIYLPMLINNIHNAPNINNPIKEILNILNSKICRDSFNIIGYHNIYPSWKEYIFYLAMKFKCARLVHKIYFK